MFLLCVGLLHVAFLAVGLGGTDGPRGQVGFCPSPPASSCDVAVSIAGPVNFTTGSADVYRINLANAGPNDAENVVLTDLVPPRLRVTLADGQYSHGTISCSVDGNIISCFIPLLRNGDVATVRIGVLLPSNTSAGVLITNMAHVTSTTCDNDAANNENAVTSSAVVSSSGIATARQFGMVNNTVFGDRSILGKNSHLGRVETASDVQVSVTCPTGIIVGGDNQTHFYAFSITNNGPSIAQNVALISSIPLPMMLMGTVLWGLPVKSGAECVVISNNITCSFGDLAANQTVTFRWAFGVPSNLMTLGNINISVYASLEPFDPVAENNLSSCSTLVVAAPSVDVFLECPTYIFIDNNRAIYKYTITAVNHGPSDAQNVFVTAMVTNPLVLSGTVTTTLGSCAVDGNNINCTIGRMAPNAEVTIIVPFYVPSNASGGVVTSIARIFHTTPDTNTGNRPFNSTVLIQLSDVSISIRGPTSICVDDPPQLITINVINNGPADAWNITLEFALDPRFTPLPNEVVITNNASPAACGFTGQLLFCSLGGLPFEGVVTVTVPFWVLPGTLAQVGVLSRANASSVVIDPVLTNNEQTISIDICEKASVVSKLISIAMKGPLTVIAGSIIQQQYTIMLERHTAFVVNGSLASALPHQWTYTPGSLQHSGSGDCNVSDNFALQCTYSAFESPVYVTFNFTVSADVIPQVVRTCISFTGSTLSPVPQNVHEVDCLSTSVYIGLGISVVTSQPACAGNALGSFYTATLLNGPSLAQNIVFTFVLPSLLTPGSSSYVTVSGAEGACSYDALVFTCQLGTLAAESQVVVRFPFSVPAFVYQQNVTATARVSFDTSNSSFSNEASVTTLICNIVDLVMELAGPLTVTAGFYGNYSYTLTVSNVGLSDAVNVTVLDEIPGVWTLVGAPNPSGAGSCTYTSATRYTLLKCQWPHIAPSTQRETVMLTFQVGLDVPGGFFRNCAVANSTLYIDKNLLDNEACVDSSTFSGTDPGYPHVRINALDVLCAGSNGTFTVSIDNQGPFQNYILLAIELPSYFLTNYTTAIITHGHGRSDGNKTSCSSPNGQVLLCLILSLDRGSQIQIEFIVSVIRSARETLHAITAATVSLSDGGQTFISDQDRSLTHVCVQSDIEAFLKVPTLIASGTDGFAFAATLRNNGPADASSANFNCSVPVAFLHGDFISTDGGTCAWDANRLLCIWPGLFAANRSATVSFYFSVSAEMAAGPQVSCVSASSDSVDFVPSNNRNCGSTYVSVGPPSVTTTVFVTAAPLPAAPECCSTEFSSVGSCRGSPPVCTVAVPFSFQFVDLLIITHQAATAPPTSPSPVVRFVGAGVVTIRGTVRFAFSFPAVAGNYVLMTATDGATFSGQFQRIGVSFSDGQQARAGQCIPVVVPTQTTSSTSVIVTLDCGAAQTLVWPIIVGVVLGLIVLGGIVAVTVVLRRRHARAAAALTSRSIADMMNATSVPLEDMGGVVSEEVDSGEEESSVVVRLVNYSAFEDDELPLLPAVPPLKPVAKKHYANLLREYESRGLVPRYQERIVQHSDGMLLKWVVRMQSVARRRKAQRAYVVVLQRWKVAKELLETERTYVSGLSQIVMLYVKPLTMSLSSSSLGVLSRTKIQVIFSVVEVMLGLNMALLEDIEARLRMWHADQCIGDIFLSMGDYLKIASQYVNNYDVSRQSLKDELKANERFRTFVDGVTAANPRAGLSSLLILPVQRIPRYEMLIRELLRKTPAQHPDFKLLNEAFAKIRAIAQIIDTRKDEQLNFQEVIRVHSQLEPKVVGLVVPSRKFLGEYSLCLRRLLARPAIVRVFMFNDILVIASPAAAEGAGYRPRDVLRVRDVSVTLVGDHIDLSFNSSARIDLEKKNDTPQKRVESVAGGDEHLLMDGESQVDLVSFVEDFGRAKRYALEVASSFVDASERVRTPLLNKKSSASDEHAGDTQSSNDLDAAHSLSQGGTSLVDRTAIIDTQPNTSNDIDI